MTVVTRNVSDFAAIGVDVFNPCVELSSIRDELRAGREMTERDSATHAPNRSG